MRARLLAQRREQLGMVPLLRAARELSTSASVQHILGKLGVSTRTQIATWAAAQR